MYVLVVLSLSILYQPADGHCVKDKKECQDVISSPEELNLQALPSINSSLKVRCVHSVV